MKQDIASARTLLFVPGNRPDRFAKALAAGADAVILDLEDAVAPAVKDEARRLVAEWLETGQPVLLRVNAADTCWFEADLTLCYHPNVAGIVLPKAEPGANLARVAALKPTLALIESAIGVQGLTAICGTSGVKRLTIGTIDLSLDLDITAPETVLDPILLQLVVASRAASLPPPVAGVTTSFIDPAIVEADANRARQLGFGGKMCIHPAQVEPIHKGLRPSDSEIERAKRIIAADAASGGAAVALDGQMIDRPVADRARRLLTQID